MMYIDASKSRYSNYYDHTRQIQRLKISEKKRFVIFLACIFIIITSLTIFVKGYAQNIDSASHVLPNTERIVVQSGDSLWLIASQYKPEDVGIRSYIHLIKKTNQLKSSAIEVGQVLILP